MFVACDRALRRTIEYFEPKYVIGVGKFAEAKAREVAGDLDVTIASVPHPSPASPLANKGWSPLMDAALAELGIEVGPSQAPDGRIDRTSRHV